MCYNFIYNKPLINRSLYVDTGGTAADAFSSTSAVVQKSGPGGGTVAAEAQEA
jgi:hypothetical protein